MSNNDAPTHTCKTHPLVKFTCWIVLGLVIVEIFRLLPEGAFSAVGSAIGSFLGSVWPFALCIAGTLAIVWLFVKARKWTMSEDTTN